MPSASIKKKISCSKKNLIGMVHDIEKYPEFVPWCLEGKIHSTIDRRKFGWDKQYLQCAAKRRYVGQNDY